MELIPITVKSKDKSSNFTRSEVLRLQTLIDKYKDIILCKKTDAISLKQKQKTWLIIEKDFNATGEMRRTAKQLKNKFENKKKVAKKEASKERLEMSRTGGGSLPPPPPSQTEDSIQWIRAIMPSSIIGNESIYDDDVIPKASISNIDLQEHTEIMIECDKDKNVINPKPDVAKDNDNLRCSLLLVENTPNNWAFDTSTPHSSLQRPIASPLKGVIKRKQYNLTCKDKLNEKKVDILNELQDLEVQKLRDSCSQQRAEHLQRMRHNEEKHILEIEKLEIENLRSNSK